MENDYTGILNSITNGLLIENIETGEIVYTNKIVNELLKITDINQKLNMIDILSNKEVLGKLHKDIKNRLESETEIFETVFFKNFSDINIEVIFRTVWLNEDENLVAYIFQCSKEWIGENQLSFYEVTEFLPNGVIVVEIERELKLALMYANEEHFKILGYSEESSPTNKIDMFLNDFIFEEDREWVLNEIRHNSDFDDKIDIEYRVRQCDGNLKWVRLFGRVMKSNIGNKLLYASLKDLSEIRNINDKVQLEKIVFNKIAEITNEVLFRLDLSTNVITFFTNSSNIFSNNPTMENFPQCIIDLDFIHKDDISVFYNMVKCFKNGVYKKIEMRHKTDEGYEWYKTIYNIINSDDGNALLVMGKFINIHIQKLYEEQAKVDLLTHLYNKITTENEINAVLKASPEQEHILFIIDIDNFKMVNDKFGHHFGDGVLRDISSDINQCFRKNDILGRLGGDEFVVLMKNCEDDMVITEIAKKLCTLLQKIYIKDNERVSISASIGIATYPYNGKTYEELYKMADRALYISKRKGKNCFTKYEDIISDKVKLPSTNLGRRKSDTIDTRLVNYIFEKIYASTNVEKTFFEVLSIVADKFDSDGCYIVEETENKIFENTFGWSKATDYLDHSITLSNESISYIFAQEDKNGVFYTNDIYEIKDEEFIEILKERSIQSLLLIQSTIGKNAIFGCYKKDSKKVWSVKEVDTLRAISKIIFMALENYNKIKSLQSKINT